MQAVSENETDRQGPPSSPSLSTAAALPGDNMDGGVEVSDSEMARSIHNNNNNTTATATQNNNSDNNSLSEEDEFANDDESEYEYEDDDDAAAFGGFIEEQTFAIVEDDHPPQKKWKEPTKQAVDMSLRAEKETSGSKRRLAQDLYKIMQQDTSEAGFSLSPLNEEKMDKWIIKLFGFDQDSNLAKDMVVCGVNHVELEISFPDDYPFEPPFVRVVSPRFQRQTGFVMNGALCMELLTKDGWNPINDIESVIVSIRSLMVVGDGRLQAAVSMPESKRKELLEAHMKKQKKASGGDDEAVDLKRERSDSSDVAKKKNGASAAKKPAKISKATGGQYSAAEAKSAYAHISDYHKKKGWDNSGWWAKKG